ncbi:hypothetical protein AB1N83_010523 [Pleurotus pulmonarius]
MIMRTGLLTSARRSQGIGWRTGEADSGSAALTSIGTPQCAPRSAAILWIHSHDTDHPARGECYLARDWANGRSIWISSQCCRSVSRTRLIDIAVCRLVRLRLRTS